jgi:hypothetical protein
MSNAACDPVRLSPEESQLFAVLHQGLSQAKWDRYRELIQRRRAEMLTEPERQELIELTDKVELKNAARMEVLVELGRRRGVALGQLMRQLGIRRPCL